MGDNGTLINAYKSTHICCLHPLDTERCNTSVCLGGTDKGNQPNYDKPNALLSSCSGRTLPSDGLYT